MKFATVEEAGRTVRCGPLEGEALFRLRAGTTVLELIRAGELQAAGATARAAGDAVPPAGLRPLPLEPPSVRDFVAFEEHVERVATSVVDDAGVVPEWDEAPTFCFTNPHALTGVNDDVPIPPGPRLVDFDLEVACVVGREPASPSPSPEQVNIVGYTIWSARDLQRREMMVNLGAVQGKGAASTLGSWLVTSDELKSYRDSDGFQALDLRVSVNGEENVQDLLSNVCRPFEELVAYAGRGTGVRAGEILGSGTCGNGACLAELWGRRGARDPRPLRPSDVVEMAVEGVGRSATPSSPVPNCRRCVRRTPVHKLEKGCEHGKNRGGHWGRSGSGSTPGIPVHGDTHDSFGRARFPRRQRRRNTAWPRPARWVRSRLWSRSCSATPPRTSPDRRSPTMADRPLTAA
ncbi:2-keto-4-pentenoate hydratase/2-oxohepta-3-ene-1,7-dioic acid hydratase in catechol pathway [Amycolatopsis thermophila]|uniref:2-keto-4-pentenoate hydratase/2-oxohepta-3-ene-1,7-dioic acid hydratase in catechol pathway n=1 Tax=Amycolatopsis thermophila TaxID=206084 RepID=A0ABU0F636_9PSEU|nr:2-keto-4-pentenoate hydratase/2-oxohepta-3-ene-1,7-dioic acid hydratase in catechol pathway [Amycolatopsis thermophila]